MLKRAELAKELFKTGLNCSQSVVVAFADVINLDETAAAKLAAGLGGGMGRQREVCGAVSGAAMVLGYLCSGEDGRNKKCAYEKVREFSDEFKRRNGSIVCRELLGLDERTKESAEPSERTAEYYRKRPCAELVFDAAEIVEAILCANKA